MLDRSLASGMRDLSGAARDPDLAALRADARWAALETQTRERVAAWEKTLAEPALRRELLALMTEDQVARNAVINDKNERTLAAMEAIDRKSTTRMKQIIAAHGWPGKRLVGEDGAHAAWLLVQHADRDPDFQRRCLSLMEPLVTIGEVTGTDFAYLYDRIAVAEQRPQRFGTQFGADREPRPIEDPAHVDERRASVGLGTMAEYRQQMLRVYGPPPTAPTK